MIPEPLLELLRADTPALREQGLELLRLHLGDAEAVAALLAADLLAPDAALSGARLPGISLAGLDLSAANLSGADLRGARLHQINLRSARLSGARLEGADLRGADLSAADLSGADLSRTDLRDADLRGATATAVILRGALCAPGTHLPTSSGRAGVLLLRPGGSLAGASLPGLEAPSQELRGIDLRGANLSGADLHDAVLRGADLRDADLRGALLRGACLVYSDLRGADLRDADLRGADLRSADLEGARLDGALRSTPPVRPPIRAEVLPEPLPIQIVGLRAPHLDLRELWLCRARLPEADLRGADLRGAVLEDVDLSGADLRGASLAGAVLRRVQLGGARLDGADLRWSTVEETFLPSGAVTGSPPRVARVLPPAFPRAAAEVALRLRSAAALWALCGQLRAGEPYREFLAASAAWLEASGPPRTPSSDPGWLSRRTLSASPSFHHQARRAQVARLREDSVGWLDAWTRHALAQVWEEVLPQIGALRWVATGGLLAPEGPETGLRGWSPAHPAVLLAGPPELPRFPEDARQLPWGTEGLGPDHLQARCWVWGGFWSHLDIRASMAAVNQEALLCSPQAVVLESLRLPSPAALYPLVRARGSALPNLRTLTLILHTPGTHVIPDLSAATPNLERLEILRAPDAPGARGLTRIELTRMRLPRLHHLAVHPLEPPRGSASSNSPPQIHSLRIGEVELPSLLTVDILAERLSGLHRVRPCD